MKKLKAMAWRIDEAVTRGQIDNTIEGRTTGRIWLLGRDEPLVLKLEGDCWRDLAGTRLDFENPTPKACDDAAAIDLDQTGIVGDMTASRKSRVPLGDEGEILRSLEDSSVPYEWKNILYLEWFSEINGRVVIETSRFRLSISEYEWQMDEDAEEAQKLANLNSMRDFMAQVIRRPKPGDHTKSRSGKLDEYAWEERLKESDRLTDAYQEVLEKYMDDADCERKEAFVMGWDGLLDALADRDEANGGEISGGDYYDSPELSFYEWDGDEDEDEDENSPAPTRLSGETHPLQLKAKETALRSIDIAERGEGPETPSYRLISSLLQVSGKLAGALNNRGSGYEPETGFVLAVLKRCLSWLNEAFRAGRELIDSEKDPDQKAALEHLLRSTFEIRDAIVELRRELKQS